MKKTIAVKVESQDEFYLLNSFRFDTIRGATAKPLVGFTKFPKIIALQADYLEVRDASEYYVESFDEFIKNLKNRL